MDLGKIKRNFKLSELYDVVRTIETVGEVGGEQTRLRLDVLKEEGADRFEVQMYALQDVDYHGPNGLTRGDVWVKYPNGISRGDTAEEAVEFALALLNIPR